MLKHPTLDQLYALGLHGMAKAFAEIAASGEADGLGHHEWLGLLLDREASWRPDKRLAARLRVAKFTDNYLFGEFTVAKHRFRHPCLPV